MKEEKIVSVEVVGTTENGVEMKVVIEKIEYLGMFSSYDFQKRVEDLIANKIVANLPLETLNEVIKKIDLEAVAKLATIDLAHKSSGRNY